MWKSLPAEEPCLKLDKLSLRDLGHDRALRKITFCPAGKKMLHKFCFFLGLKSNWLVKILQNSHWPMVNGHWPWDDSTEWCDNSKTWLFFFEKTSLVKLSELTEPKVQQCEHQIFLNHTWVFSCCSDVDILIWFLSDEFWNEQLQTALFKVGHATRL